MTIVCPRCHGDGKVPDAVTLTEHQAVVIYLRNTCRFCLGLGTIYANRRQIKAEGRRMKAAQIARNVNEYNEAKRYDVSVFDYSRFEQGKPVSEDVMRKLGAKP